MNYINNYLKLKVEMERHQQKPKNIEFLILKMSLQYLHSLSFSHIFFFYIFPNWTVDGTHYEFHKNWLV